MPAHLMIVGGAGQCGGLLRAPGRAEYVTALTQGSTLSALEASHTDAVLPLAELLARPQLIRLVHNRRRVTHVASFDTEYHETARAIATELRAARYPDISSRTGSPPRAGYPFAPITTFVPVFAERGVIRPMVVIETHVPDHAEPNTICLVAGAGIESGRHAELLETAMVATRISGLRSGIAVVAVRRPDAGEMPTVSTTVALPPPVLCTLVREATTIDIPDLVARQAVGLLILDRIDAALRLPVQSCCAYLITGTPGSSVIAGIDRAESIAGVRVEIPSEQGADGGFGASVIVWAKAFDAAHARDRALLASMYLGVSSMGR